MNRNYSKQCIRQTRETLLTRLKNRLDRRTFREYKQKLTASEVVVYSSFEPLIVSTCRIYISGGERDVLNHPKFCVNRVNKYNTAVFSRRVKFSIVLILAVNLPG